MCVLTFFPLFSSYVEFQRRKKERKKKEASCCCCCCCLETCHGVTYSDGQTDTQTDRGESASSR